MSELVSASLTRALTVLIGPLLFLVSLFLLAAIAMA